MAMQNTEVFKVLMDCYSNPTKIGVLLLLSEQEKMTVTQMSEYLDVSRSNLYHFVGQMVKDGVLNEPEVVAKKNYVEKFYTLNEDLFRISDMINWPEFLSGTSLSEVRSMVASSLLGISANLRIMAERLAIAGDDEINRIKSWISSTPYFILVSTLKKDSSDRVRKHLDEMMEDLLDHDATKDRKDEKEIARLMFIFLPLMNILPKLD